MTQQAMDSSMSSCGISGPDSRPARRLPVAAMLTALTLIIVSGLLALTSWRLGDLPGCRPGEGCDVALSSVWARWMGVPVSLLAMALYVGVLTALGMRGLSTRETLRRMCDSFLTAAAVAAPGAAAWFIYIMLRHLGEPCIYCLTAHGLAMVLAGLITLELSTTWRRAAATRPVWLASSVMAGLTGLTVLIGGQIIKPGATVAVDNIPAAQTAAVPTTQPVYDNGPGPDRRIHIPMTDIELRVADCPLVGPPDARNIIVLFGDYACPHCHEFTDQLIQAVDRYPGQLALLRIMAPLNAGCNPAVQGDTSDRYDASCNLAKLALALFQIDRGAYEKFERKMASSPTTPTLPDAVGQATEIAGRQALREQLGRPEVAQMLARHVAHFASLPPDYLGLPVVVMQGRYIRGTPSTPRETFELLEQQLHFVPPAQP